MKNPGIYQIPKMRNLNFSVVAQVTFWACGGVSRGGGYQRWEDYALEVLVKTPNLYQVTKLRNMIFLNPKIWDGPTDGRMDQLKM